jgi:hypothetical protein
MEGEEEGGGKVWKGGKRERGGRKERIGPVSPLPTAS